MNVQLSVLNVALGKTQNKLEATKKEAFNKDKDNFDSILKETQESKKNDTNLQPKNNISKTKSSNNNSSVKTSDNMVDETTNQPKNEEQNIPTEEEIIESIEEKTGITKEKIVAALDELGITVYELFLPQNLQQFLQQINNVEDPMELLLIPDINQTYKNIMNVLNEYEERFPNLQEILGQNEIFHNSVIENEELNLNDLTRESKVDEDNSQKVIPSDKKNIFDENLQLDEDLSQGELNDKSQKEDSPIIEIESEEKTSTATIDNNEEKQEINVEEKTSELFDNVSVHDKNIVIEQNTIIEKPAVNNVLNQLKSNPIDREQLIKQMVEHIKVNVNEDSAEMNLQLKPDNLGKLSLKVVTERGIITAQFVAESQAVKEIIEANFNQLKDVLQEQGLKIENLEVYVQQNFQEQQSKFMERRPTKSSKRISEIISNLSEDTLEVYENDNRNPYKRFDGEIDFSA